MGSVTSLLPKTALAGFPPEDILSLVVDSEAVIPKSKSTHTFKKSLRCTSIFDLFLEVINDNNIEIAKLIIYR